jgi:hypothetical protein
MDSFWWALLALFVVYLLLDRKIDLLRSEISSLKGVLFEIERKSAARPSESPKGHID